MPTKAELKTIINDNIRIKTAPSSITKINHAAIADAALDYTDQESALKVDKEAGKSLISDTEITRLASVTQTPAKTNGSVTAIGGSKATLEFDINTVSKSGGSDVKLPTTTEVGKEVLFLASNYSSTVSVYVNDAEDIKLSGGANGVSGNLQSLQISANEAYRFIYRTNGYWYFEKIIDIPTNYYLLTSERSTSVTTDGASDFKVPSVKAVKTYVDANIASGGILYYADRFFQAGTAAPVGQNQYSNTLIVGNYTMGDNYRDFKVTRVSTGLYYFDIIYKSIVTNVNKMMLMCGSGQCRVTGTLSGIASGENYIRWVIETRDNSGALADDQMNGSTPITITYYP